MNARVLAVWGVIGCLSLPPASAQSPSRDLTQASIEELMNIEVTSASKKQRPMSQTAASVYVITQEDIRRSGVSALPELLRMVPGLQVARIDKSVWAVSIRGFSDEFSNKLLVLVDGRSVYSDLASGVFWDSQETFLDNIERIEIVRGPGGATWGANAVNGVINIITKNAKDTQGGLAVAAVGSEEQPQAGARWGGRLGENGFYRIYGQYDQREPMPTLDGHGTQGDWRDGLGGFRFDWDDKRRDRLMVEGGVFRDSSGEGIPNYSLMVPVGSSLPVDITSSGAHLLGRWVHTQSSRSEYDLQVYYDRYSRNDFQLPYDQNTIDLDFQHHYRVSESSEITWGGGYRYKHHDTTPTPDYHLDPLKIDTHLENAFLQYDTYLVPGRLQLTTGVKLEENSFTGFEVEPTVRLLWSHGERASSWLAISRAVRTPALVERDLFAVRVTQDPTSGLKLAMLLQSDPNFESENLAAYEAGHRQQLTNQLYLDVSLYFNRYSNLGGVQLGAPQFVPSPVPHIEIPNIWKNGLWGDSYGGEVSLDWMPVRWWRFGAGYSPLWVCIHSPSDLLPSASNEGNSPRNQVQLASYLDLPRHFQFDSFAYFTGTLPALWGQPIPVPNYWRADARLGWNPVRWLDISISGQNLTTPRHLEQVSYHLAQPLEVRRSVLAAVRWMF